MITTQNLWVQIILSFILKVYSDKSFFIEALKLTRFLQTCSDLFNDKKR